MTTRTLIGAALAAAACVLIPAAMAEQATLDATATRMVEAVDKHALDTALKLVTPQDGLRLILVSRQRAAALSCEGFAVDEAKYASVMADIVRELTPLVEPTENNLPVDVVMNAYNMTVGGQLAAAAYDPEAYCAHVGALREELRKSDMVNVLK